MTASSILMRRGALRPCSLEPADAAPKFAQTERWESSMPTSIKMIAGLEQPSEFASDGFRSAALFVWIGLMVALIAASTGEQGVWF
jgi:hypothetical protein